MLKINVGMSRKVSKDFNSTGFSVNLEGDIGINLDDPEAVVEKIKEYYDVAEETLAQQIERHKSDDAIASHDQVPSNYSAPPPRINKFGNRQPSGNDQNGNGRNRLNESSQPATNKQVQFLLTLGKREGLTKPKLEERIGLILGREAGVYDLTKQEAGTVLDCLTSDNGSRHTVSQGTTT